MGSVTDFETSVLIVGAGPAGLTSSLALTNYGVDHLLIERYEGTAHTPRAHIVNQRTVEIMRQLGIQTELESVSSPHETMRHSIWYTKLNQPEIARKESWGTERERLSEYSRVSPVLPVNCPQTQFEPMLVRELDKRGTSVMFGHELVEMKQNEDGWLSVLRRRSDGSTLTVQSKYIVGSDGARATVLNQAGLTIEGERGLFRAVNIWFQADLTKYFAHRPGVLCWNIHPGPQPPLGLGTFICYTPFTEFALTVFEAPDSSELRDMTEEDAIASIERAVGEPVDDIEIQGIFPWQVNAQVAPKFSNNGVFCMGDAVHRHPPTNGLGLNMSVADGFNLAWKLAMVERGIASETLLDSYTLERQPVAAAGVERAINSFYQAASIQSAIGITPDLPEEKGWEALATLRKPTAEGDLRRAALRNALKETDNRFNAIGLELGYQYTTGAVILDTYTPRPEHLDPVLDFEATTRPGARVPHARLEVQRTSISTLDLINGLEFALLVGTDCAHWREAVEIAATEMRIPISVYEIGGEEISDPYFEWADARQVDHSGAVLVRPDQHIAWRAVTVPEDPVNELKTALMRILSVKERSAV